MALVALEAMEVLPIMATAVVMARLDMAGPVEVELADIAELEVMEEITTAPEQKRLAVLAGMGLEAAAVEEAVELESLTMGISQMCTLGAMVEVVGVLTL